MCVCVCVCVCVENNLKNKLIQKEEFNEKKKYVHFRANPLGKGMNPLILPAMG